jgi:hypothetical protein
MLSTLLQSHLQVLSGTVGVPEGAFRDSLERLLEALGASTSEATLEFRLEIADAEAVRGFVSREPVLSLGVPGGSSRARGRLRMSDARLEAMQKSRIVILGFGTARQKRVLER